MQVQQQLGMEPKPNQVCMMIFDHDSVLVIFLHINLAWFGLCFDLRSNLHAARKLTWMYMGINLQARVFFCFFLFWAVGATFSMRFRRSAGQNTRDWPCAVGCRTRGHTRPGPRAFRAKAAGRTAELTSKPDFSFVLFGSWLWVRIFRCGFDGAPARTPEIGPAPLVAAPGAILARARALSGRKAAGCTAASWVKWQAEVELDRMTFAVFPGPTPGGGGTGPGRGSGPVGLGPWGAPGTDPPAPWSPPPARRTASYR